MMTDEDIQRTMENLKDTPQKKLQRMSLHFEDIGIYTKASYCIEIAEYITELEQRLQAIEAEK
jgi:polyhydroxyalkanoate synthesis regulator phasin